MQAGKVVDFIVDWLIDYLEKSGAKGFVVGVSGGVDSAVTATLSALTAAPTRLLEMPIHQAESQVDRAQNHIALLRKNHTHVSDLRLDLTDPFDVLQRVLTQRRDAEPHALALANTRARLRMITLYFEAQIHNYLVVGTGNKVEDFGVGFFTKYGDGGVDINPIADLYKSEVYALAKVLGVDEAILKAEPTDGLWRDNRSDEDQLGATYDELEWAMKNHPDLDVKTLSGREKWVYQSYVKRHEKNAHKWHPIPVAKIPESLRR